MPVRKRRLYDSMPCHKRDETADYLSRASPQHRIPGRGVLSRRVYYELMININAGVLTVSKTSRKSRTASRLERLRLAAQELTNNIPYIDLPSLALYYAVVPQREPHADTRY